MLHKSAAISTIPSTGHGQRSRIAGWSNFSYPLVTDGISYGLRLGHPLVVFFSSMRSVLIRLGYIRCLPSQEETRVYQMAEVHRVCGNPNAASAPFIDDMSSPENIANL